MTIAVRPVERGDVPAVLELVAEVLGEFGLEFGTGSPTDDHLRELPGSYADHGGAFWVALRDGELLGTAGVFPVGGGLYELRKMYLRPASRGLGLGVRLLDTAADWVRARGGTHLVLDTIEEMTRAIAFYEAHGFVRDDAQKRAARCTRGYARKL
jgi:putative acetyltransferase